MWILPGILPSCHLLVASLVGNLYQVRKQVSNKSTGLIVLKFGYEVLFEMTTEWLRFDICGAIIVAMVAI